MYEIISKIVSEQFNKSAFKSGFFEKDDLISDLYIYLAELGEDLSESEIITILKKKYFNYFEIYDIEDKKSYDKYETGVDFSTKISAPSYVNKKDNEVYEFFENIIWKDNKCCPKCKSKEVYPSETRARNHSCRSCGNARVQCSNVNN